MLQEEITGRPEISSPKSTTQLPSAPPQPDVNAIQRREGGLKLGWRAQLAVPRAAFKWLHGWCSRWPDQRDLHRMADSDSILGNADAQDRRPDSSNGVDPSRNGSFTVRYCVRSRLDRTGGLVSSHHAYCFRHF